MRRTNGIAERRLIRSDPFAAAGIALVHAQGREGRKWPGAVASFGTCWFGTK
jgi:hypothetical protein